MSWAILAGLAAVIAFAVRGAAKEVAPGASGSGVGGPAPVTTLQEAQRLGTLPPGDLAAAQLGQTSIVNSAVTTVAVSTSLTSGVTWSGASGAISGVGGVSAPLKQWDMTQGKGGGKVPPPASTPGVAANPATLFAGPLVTGVGKLGTQANATLPSPVLKGSPGAAAELRDFVAPAAYPTKLPMVIDTAALGQSAGTAVLRPLGDRTPPAAPPPNTISIAQVVPGARGARLGFL